MRTMKKFLLTGFLSALIIGGLFLWNKLPYNWGSAELPVPYPAKPVEILRFDTVTLELIGMRFHHTYEIINEPPRATVSRYRNIFVDGEDRLELDCMVTCDSSEILELLQASSVGAWDGFRGNHPKNVSDGIMFTFAAIINDGQTIRAEGSENFPKGYPEFVLALDQLLAE